MQVSGQQHGVHFQLSEKPNGVAFTTVVLLATR